MNVVMISDFYPPLLGGVEQHVSSLSGSLARRGHEVAVVTLRPGQQPEFAEEQGVRVHRIQGTSQRVESLFSNSHRPWAPPITDPELAWRIHQVLTRTRPDIVHIHDWLGRSYMPTPSKRAPKLVSTLHYYTLSCAKKSLLLDDLPCDGPGFQKCLGCASHHYGRVKGPIVTLGNWAGATLERAEVSAFIAVSRETAVRNGLAKRRVPVHIIPNFLPESRVEQVSSLDYYVDQLPTEDFLLFVGDLRRAKGIEILLAAYSGLINPPPLVLIGKTWPETPVIQSSRIHVLREWPNAAVMEAWRRSLIGLLPSIWPEPFGIVLIEAMSSGCPVIASAIGGIPDIVTDNETGLLVPPGDPLALRTAIERLLADTELRARLGTAAAQRAEEYRADRVVPRIEQVYLSVMRE